MFLQRRINFLNRMEDGDLALFPSAGLQIRNHDVHYPFRQQSDFWYLTGHNEPDSLLMLAKGLEGFPSDTLFVLPFVIHIAIKCTPI